MSLSEILDANTIDQPWKSIKVYSASILTGVDISGNLQVDGSANILGNLTVSGSINGGALNNSLVPSLDNAYNLGSALNRWQNLYLGTDAIIDGVINVNSATNQVVLSHNGGNNLTINSVNPSAPITYGIPDIGSNGLFAIATNSNDLNVNILNGSSVNLSSVSNQLVLNHNGANNVIINSANPAASRTYDIPDIGGNGSFVVATAANDITVNQLNYTTLNPAVLVSSAGTFLPTLVIGTDDTGVVYASQNGSYVKTGRVVNFAVDISISSKGANTGVCKIGNLPFAVSGSLGNGYLPTLYGDVTLNIGYNTIFLQPVSGT
jgi:hypothetical protein